MSAELTINDWLDSALMATEEVASQILACDNMSVSTRSLDPPPEAHGAYIPMNIGGGPLYLGVLSTETGCQDMARALLCMEEDEDDPEEDDVVDAVNEIANILAGVMTQQLADKFPTIELGLPLFVTGRVERTARLDSAFAETKFDNIEAQIVVLRGRNSTRGN